MKGNSAQNAIKTLDVRNQAQQSTCVSMCPAHPRQQKQLGPRGVSYQPTVSLTVHFKNSLTPHPSRWLAPAHSDGRLRLGQLSRQQCLIHSHRPSPLRHRHSTIVSFPSRFGRTWEAHHLRKEVCFLCPSQCRWQ